MNALVIANTQIRQDTAGRYCLNDLHQASGGAGKHRPSLWLGNKQAQELIAEIEASAEPTGAGIPAPVAVESVQRGLGQGTYAVKELVYAYAMWISAAFHLHVIRAYDAQVTGQRQDDAAAEPAIGLGPTHHADRMVGAARTFNALVRAGRAMRMSAARAARSANEATARATGIDLVDELDAGDLLQDTSPGILRVAADDPALQAVADYLAGRDTVTSADIIAACQLGRNDRATQIRAAYIMRRVGGWRACRELDPDGVRRRRWRRIDADIGEVA